MVLNTAKNINADNGINDLEEARRVLSNEARALTCLAEVLGENFVQAVERIYSTRGRVILTGMGKSGHIAHKIASTFSSTGTPSYFVHPAEASHGDLGMLTPEDTVIAFSNSGETTELSDILAYTKRHSIILIGITTNGESTLGKLSTISLVLPKIEEACPLGLAPTTSTTMMIALGDALATCVLKRRQFSAADFSSLHPGGKLGQKLMRVEKLMHRGLRIPLVSQSISMKEALIEMTAKGFGCLGITSDAGELVGIITDGDLRRHLDDGLLSLTVGEVMTPNPQVIAQDMLAQEALAKMNARSITSLFVVAHLGDKRPVGILHIHDCLRIGLG